MNRTVLIAPFDGQLAASLAEAATASGWSVALALEGKEAPEAENPESIPGKASAISLGYDGRTFVSAASVVLAAENALGPLSAAVLVFDPASARVDYLQAKPGELSRLVDERCASPLFLAREIVRRFEARRSGRLLLLAPESPRDAALDTLSSLADGAFEGLGNGLFSACGKASWSAFGLRDASGQPDRAARFALDLLSEAKPAKAGRWLRFTGKGGIFGQ